MDSDSGMGHFHVSVQVSHRAGGRFVVFADPGSEPILGVVTLEEFLLAADPVHRRLISVPGRLKQILRAWGAQDDRPAHVAKGKRERKGLPAPFLTS